MIIKQTQLRIAYSFLAALSAWTIAYDSYSRRSFAAAATPTRLESLSESIEPQPITRISESPFLKTATAARESHSVPRPIPRLHDLAEGTGRIAPFGVLFLKVDLDADTNEGAKSFSAGTQVRLLRHQGGKMRVTHDGSDFLVEDWQVTNDLDAARSVARSAS
jgi:hypothetical protein